MLSSSIRKQLLISRKSIFTSINPILTADDARSLKKSDLSPLVRMLTSTSQSTHQHHKHQHKASDTPTRETQRALPKQPLPELGASLGRYLDSLRPVLMTSGGAHESGMSAYARTEANVSKFLNEASSASLHDVLYQRVITRDNWAFEKNIDQYLMDTHNSLPIHASPAKVIRRQHFEDENAFLR